ncbi:HlyD family type I secretion periplasmic adaptor subunit [Microvirga guangxiensis]|uniref:Membrane fusion protein (MFP) family protein n=1 Tax=Microvirga guangxiensis TaxID=549386 RepID=A0A1G5LKX7_9HYPH|nr:HlyD family type I secretion periplasmic adaptor subunit [Microvirga guangxiensis]SCZ13553.1 type I secretion membrane fusion protein, HlyD family [Microvirga guangxiensis]
MSKHAGTNNDDFRLGNRVTAGIALGALLVVGCGGWAAVAQINGSVIAQGTVKVDQNLKVIQHRDGGIVSQISVREGDVVQAGQVLLRLDDVQTKAELSIVRSQLSELVARRARLLAERDGFDGIPVPQEGAFLVSEADLISYGELRLFEGNRAHRESQKEQLQAEITQLEQEIKGLQFQQVAKVRELDLVSAEHGKLKGLADKGLIEGSRMYGINRDVARLTGEVGEVDASIARARARMSSIRLQIISIDENARTEAQRELSAVATKISELNDRRIALEDRLSRTDIRAPLSGIVNELSVHTVGGVITPAETLATIVPEKATLKIEAKLSPVDVDQVFVGQSAKLRFSAFNQRTTPEVKGEIAYVSAAATRDQATNTTHYLADLKIDPVEFEKLAGLPLKPGMPVEVFVATQDRTAISYLTKPFTDQFAKAFREE